MANDKIKAEEQPNAEDYVSVDAHVLASPAFADVNHDGSKEMFVPVSYFFDRRK